MGLLIKTKWLWLPGMAMLVSSSVTSKFIQSNTYLTDQIGQWHSHHTLPSAVYDPCCTYLLPDTGTSNDFQPAPQQSETESLPVANVWTRIRAGFEFPEVDPDAVRNYIDEYVKHPHLFVQILKRGEPYLFHILNRLEQAGMPSELALLPIVESAFDPFATSPAGAAGIWQFMPETADYLGLNQDWWYDGRRDVIASTEAAIDYLGRLNKRFDGDWPLALAAYNAGGARVQRAIRHNRNAGKPSDYWHLALPEETQSYVPKLIALRTIIQNPHEHNVVLPDIQDSGYFTTVEIQGQLELRVAARLSGIPLQELQRLNPAYGLSITPPDRAHALLVPTSVADQFRTRIAQLPMEQRIQSIRHRIRPGDNLSTIAQQYRTTVADIRKANRLKGSKIIAGDLLIIPVAIHEDTLAANANTDVM
jgi:membrane-bound lytic murein transglycosylase D